MMAGTPGGAGALSVDTLSTKCIWDIMNEKPVDAPVVQIVAMKKIASANNKPERWRLQINDGFYKQQSTMLATQLNGLVNEGTIEKMCLMQLDNYICNEVLGRMIIIVLKATVLGKVDAVLGTPVLLKDEHVKTNMPPGGPVAAGGAAMDGVVAAKVEAKPESKPDIGGPPAGRSPMAAARPKVSPGKAAFNPYKSPTGFKPMGGASGAGAASSSMGSSPYQPIATLGMYNSRFKIRARCTKKGDIRRWKNDRGEGQLFSVDLVDESGEIRATAFRETVDRLQPVFEVGKVYIISNGKLRVANPKFNNLNNRYEMNFESNTEVELAPEGDDAGVPDMKFDFVPFQRLDALLGQSALFADVIGVCTECNEPVTINTRAGKELTKRDVMLMDRDATLVSCTLWSGEAEEFENSGGGVGVAIAIKAAKLSDYNGVSLSVSGQSTMVINPNIDEALTLLGWYQQEGKDADVTKITQVQASRSTPRAFISQIKDEGMGRGEKPDYFMVKGTVMKIFAEKCLYKACPNKVGGKDCNKKLVDNDDGTFRCEKCNRTSQDFKWRMFLPLSIADHSGETWVTAFQDTAETLMGHSADKLGAWQTEESPEFNHAVADATFKQWLFKCRAKEETWQSETKVKVSAVAVQAVEPVSESKHLIDEINKYLTM